MSSRRSAYAHVALSARARRLLLACVATAAVLLGLAAPALAAHASHHDRSQATVRVGHGSGLARGSYHASYRRVSGLPTTRPRFTGEAHVGQVLRAHQPGHLPKKAVVTYQWLRDKAPAKRGTHPTYQVRRADRGHRLSLQVTFKLPKYPKRVLISHGVRVR